MKNGENKEIDETSNQSEIGNKEKDSIANNFIYIIARMMMTKKVKLLIINKFLLMGIFEKWPILGPTETGPRHMGHKFWLKILSLLFIFSQNMWPISGPFSWASLCWATNRPQKITILF